MRLFLALPLPPSVVALATEVQTRLLSAAIDAKRTSFRPVPFASARPHITLAFLGASEADVPAALRLSTQSALKELALSEAPRLVARRDVASFSDSVRVAYMPVTTDANAIALQRALYVAAALHVPLMAAREEFRAHVTVARAKSGARTAPARRRELEDARVALRGVDETMVGDVVFEATRVALFESRRNDDDVLVYEEVWSIPVVQHGTVG